MSSRRCRMDWGRRANWCLAMLYAEGAIGCTVWVYLKYKYVLCRHAASGRGHVNMTRYYGT